MRSSPIPSSSGQLSSRLELQTVRGSSKTGHDQAGVNVLLPESIGCH